MICKTFQSSEKTIIVVVLVLISSVSLFRFLMGTSKHQNMHHFHLLEVTGAML